MSNYPAHTWIEPFSSRETEILGLISMGMSNHEIARKLHLSPETVKWYNKQIFSKLGVSSRTLAVARARELHLLSHGETAEVEEPVRARHNLPARLTSFVGRAKEIDEVKELLRTSRLVVLTGPGGTGKTRLALETAAQLIGSYQDGVWLVELAPIRDAGLVADAIAQALHLGLRGNAPVNEILKRSLKSKHLLLLLDNFEHLLQAASLVSELLVSAPQVSILATSRERLHVYGEQEYPVSPLELPDPVRRESADRLLAYDAINLFMQRARAARPGFSLQESQAEALAQVCVRLDGLPLALELAASQVKIFPPAALAQRLTDVLNALPAGPRDLPARQQTLRGTIQWSYDLLPEEEKTLFALLAVFRGGATLEAIEKVCTGINANLLDLLGSLVDKNLLLAREAAGGELRFSMLETIHEYAWERLQSGDMANTAQRRHAACFTYLAEQASEEIRDRRQSYWHARLQVEQDNLRAALAWSLYGNETEYGVRLVAALRDYWYYNGYVAEARRWMDLALEKKHAHPPALQAGVLLASGGHAFAEHDLHRTGIELREAVRIYEEIGDERLAAWSKIKLGISYLGKPEAYQEATALCREGLDVFMRLGDLPGIAQAYNILGELARTLGDYDAAQEYYETCMDVSVESGEQIRVAMCYINMGFIAYRKQDYRKSADLIHQGLVLIQALDNDYGLSTFIGSLAGSLAMLGDPQRAARLLGASFALLEANGSAYQPSDMPEIEEYIRVIKDLLGEAAYQEAWQLGRKLTLEEAVDLALSPLPVKSIHPGNKSD